MVDPQRDLLDDRGRARSAQRPDDLRHVRDGLGDRKGTLLVLLIELIISEPDVQPEAKRRYD